MATATDVPHTVGGSPPGFRSRPRAPQRVEWSLAHAHASALARLDIARAERRRLGDELGDPGTAAAAEPGAAAQLDAARAQVSAREAWVAWVERCV